MPSASAISCRLVPAKPRSANSRMACSYISFSTSSRRTDEDEAAPAFLRGPGDELLVITGIVERAPPAAGRRRAGWQATRGDAAGHGRRRSQRTGPDARTPQIG